MVPIGFVYSIHDSTKGSHKGKVLIMPTIKNINMVGKMGKIMQQHEKLIIYALMLSDFRLTEKQLR